MKKKNLISGTFLYYDTENSNGRIYTRKCAEDIVRQFKEFDSKVPMLGQINYPDVDSFGRGNLSEISHRIKEIHINEDKKSIDGTIEILETPCGKKLLEMLDYDLGKFNELYVVRSRGLGEVNENKEVTNFEILSFDVVSKETDAFKNNQEL